MFDVSIWSLTAPVYTNGVTYTSMAVGKDGVRRIQVAESGLVRIEREGAKTLIIHGLSWGEEAEAKPEEPKITAGAQKAVASLRGK